MIRDIIEPKDSVITIHIPKEYIGKKIEYIVFPLESEKNVDKKGNEFKSLKGALKQYADPSKMELENKAWKLYIKERYQNK